MLTLAAADTLYGIASTASKLTCTIFGMELSGAVETYKVLYQGQLPSTVGLIYTVPTITTTMAKSIHIVNTKTAGPETFQLFRGGSTQDKAITPVLTIPTGGSAHYENRSWSFLNSLGQIQVDVGSAHPGLDVHSDLGLATGSELVSHSVNGSHFTAMTTPNTGASDSGKWSRIGYGTIIDRYGETFAEANFLGGGSASSTMTRGAIRFRIRQDAAFASQPVVLLELVNGRAIHKEDFVLVTLDVAGPTTFEIYARVTRVQEWLSIRPSGPVSQYAASFTWDTCQDFVTSLPAGGTQYACQGNVGGVVSLGPLTADTAGVSASSPFVDITGLSFNVVSGRSYTFEYMGTYTVAVGANAGLVLAIKHPGGTLQGFIQISYSGPGTFSGELVTASDTATGQATTDVDNTARFWNIRGTYVCTTSGAVDLRYKRGGSSAQTVKIKNGSGGWMIEG